ncbi:NUDIX hydrolase [Ectobacillus sp. JY-23]|uniref:NUDIX domain-containing protein n=1 Tax=Ectobacillus sp. JY-23 TaxID=2933872 RepID=UPI001FF5A7DF|nr:NUDIX hydrolase [Ectobacillus sp. JY-23]UOY92540.1 NUDIX hydrolase [Ectobacillus sp. JY-23]
MSNDKALKQYDVRKYRTPDGYTSDIAVFTIVSDYSDKHKPPVMTLQIMLIKRAVRNAEGHDNIEGGKWALPGGFVQPDETALQAAKRELAEETGITDIHMKHFGMYDKPGRDPRGWILSNAHYAIVPESYVARRRAADDAAEVALFGLEEALKLNLAFDHHDIISDAIRIIREDLLQTTIAKAFLPTHFTYSELQAVLKTVTDDPAITSEASFSRKIKTLPFIRPVPGRKTQRTSKTPAQLFEFIDMNVVKSIYTARY